MTAPTPRTARRRRGVAALLTTLALLISPAAAMADQWDESGPGSGGNGDASSGYDPNDSEIYECGQTIGKLPNVLYKKINGKWRPYFASAYPGCLGLGVSVTGKTKICPVGYEVYRFYGIKGKAPNAVTRSRLNMPSWCGTESVYSFAAQTSWDNRIAKGPGLPDFKASASSGDQKRNGLPSQVGRRETEYLTSGTPTKVFGKCDDVSTPNPLIDWMAKASPAERVAYRAAIGNAYDKLSRSKVKGKAVNKTYPKTAAAELGMREVRIMRYRTMPDQQRFPGQAPTEDKSGPYAYAKFMQFEKRECATAFNFAAVSDSVTKKQLGPTPVYGSCYVPLMRQARQMSAGGRKYWAFQEISRGYGERYSTYFRDQKDLGDKVPSSWRTAMRNDYLNRASKLDNGFFGPKGQQMIPANHYPGEKTHTNIGAQVPFSTRDSAKDLAALAKCRFGNTVTLDIPATDPPPTTAVMNLKVTSPKVLQAGGARYVAEFRVKGNQNQMVCAGGKSCGNTVTLAELSYRMRLVGLNGYVQCAAGQVSGCDYRILSLVPGGPNKDGVARVEFYTGTQPTERVQLVLDQIKAAYSYQVKSSGLHVSGYNPITGAPYKVDSKPVISSRKVAFTPGAVGAPVALTKSGSAWTAQWPVVAAVNVPTR